jgi:hypothetical protein
MNGDGVTIYVRWDAQAGAIPGWYCEHVDDEGHVVGDSAKAWYPVDVDRFGEDQVAELVQALRAAFPWADIVPPAR